MPTTYPKCAPTELMGLLVLLQDHHGEQDLARLADDLDLEIDEILPSSDFAEALRLVSVNDGRVTFTETGRKVVGATIRERKNLLREQLKATTLYATLIRALEGAPGNQMPEEEATRLIAFTAAPADDAVLNIINWGRYTELFRYDPEQHVLTLVRHRPSRPGSGSIRGASPGTPESVRPPATLPAPSAPAPDPTARIVPAVV
ncbi:MAG: AAA-associated domain-containing protein [Thermoplasmata archaeon]